MHRQRSAEQDPVLARLVSIRRAATEQHLTNLLNQMESLETRISTAQRQISDLDTTELSDDLRGMRFMRPHIDQTVTMIQDLQAEKRDLEIQIANAKHQLARAIHAGESLKG